MGKILSILTRPIRNFNVENRAHKVISKDKPTRAPTYEANIREAEKVLQENPSSYEDLLKKDLTLDINLKDVYVKSYDPEVISKSKGPPVDNANRPLPLSRRAVPEPEFGFHEPTLVTPGRCTLKQVVQILSDHQLNIDNWNTTKMAEKYKLQEQTIENLIKYFRVYQVYLPQKGSKGAYAGPVVPKSPRIGPSTEKDNLTGR